MSNEFISWVEACCKSKILLDDEKMKAEPERFKTYKV
jgi:hypothetical protein